MKNNKIVLFKSKNERRLITVCHTGKAVTCSKKWLEPKKGKRLRDCLYVVDVTISIESLVCMYLAVGFVFGEDYILKDGFRILGGLDMYHQVDYPKDSFASYDVPNKENVKRWDKMIPHPEGRVTTERKMEGRLTNEELVAWVLTRQAEVSFGFKPSCQVRIEILRKRDLHDEVVEFLSDETEHWILYWVEKDYSGHKLYDLGSGVDPVVSMEARAVIEKEIKDWEERKEY